MKIGIALGGGGAKGFAHLGVLEVLIDHGFEFEVVSGTSVGALIGAFYADGSLSALKDEALSIKLTDIPLLLSPAWSKQGLFSGKSALDRLGEHLSATNIEDLKKPFAAVSVDLLTGDIIVFNQGNLRHAVRASISIPAIFTPIPDGTRLLIDGGVLEPVPVKAARDLGADFVVAVDLFGNRNASPSTAVSGEKLLPQPVHTALSYLRTISAKTPLSDWLNPKTDGKKSSPNVIEIFEHTLAITQRSITQSRLQTFPPDLVICPAVTDIGLLDFHQGEIGYQRGIEAGRKIVSALKESFLKTGKPQPL